MRSTVPDRAKEVYIPWPDFESESDAKPQGQNSLNLLNYITPLSENIISWTYELGLDPTSRFLPVLETLTALLDNNILSFK